MCILLCIVGGVIIAVGFWMIGMPGRSYRGPLPPLTEAQKALRDALRRDVTRLAGEIGDRNVWKHDRLDQAAEFIESSLSAAGYRVKRQTFEADRKSFHNIEAEIRGSTRPEEIVIIGAHYDTSPGTPGANDNGSGVAALLALARSSTGSHPARTLRFVAFANEEPPYFQTPRMGSYVYAKRCRERDERIVGMISLETIGYYRDDPGSQRYPSPFDLLYPSTGNFIAFVGNLSSRSLVRRSIGAFRHSVQFPSEGGALPEAIPAVDLSDQWAFHQFGYPAFMLTDTAFFRYPWYHLPEDTPEKLDYDRMTRVVEGMQGVIRALVE
jgi:Zn-dependent M28 family amino/carboxypeptidase